MRGDPWRWLAAERANLVALVEQVHAAGLWDRAWRLAETLPAMSDWRADWRAWARTPLLALDADTGSPRFAGIAMRRLGEPGDIANGVLFFAAERSSWVNGQTISIDGGHALL